jgi:phage terminase large subunit
VKVVLPNEFEPRAYQKRAMRFFDGGGKRAITVWHRRAGKDLTAAHQTVKQAHQEVGMYWHFFPTFQQARRSIWEGYRKDGKRLLENVFPGFLDPKRPGSIVARKNDAQMFLELKCGSIWRLMGSDRTESVGAGPKGVVFSEFALCRPSAWDLVRPMVRESNGWSWFITTPRGPNHAKKLYDAATAESGWFRDIQTVHSTGLTYASNRDPNRQLSATEMLAEEREEGMEEALVRQEYLCDWSAANVGAVWGDLLEALEKRGGLELFDSETDGVFTAWDLGLSDATAIWFFRVRDGAVEVIDWYEAHGKPLSHYFDELDARAERHGYRYVKHWLPHDARAKTLASHVSILDQFLTRYSSSAVAIGPDLSLLDGIQAARWLFQQPAFRIHPRCSEGIEALRAYRYGYDEDRKTFGSRPVHDWSSHTADAFRYLATVARASDLLTRKPVMTTRPPVRPLNEAFNLDELFEAHGSGSRRGRI